MLTRSKSDAPGRRWLKRSLGRLMQLLKGNDDSGAGASPATTATEHCYMEAKRKFMKAERTLTQAERAIADVERTLNERTLNERTLKTTKRVSLFVLQAALLAIVAASFSPVALADHLRLTDGTSIEVDEAWEDTQGIWYRRGGVTHLLDRARVRAIERKNGGSNDGATGEAERAGVSKTTGVTKTTGARGVVKQVAGEMETSAETLPTVWIYLVGGARMEVDEATETAEGVWYRRGNLSIFIERTRIERVAREQPREDVADAATATVAAPSKRARRERFWTTGNKRIDALIRQNGAAYGVDPYLVFCVMENESSFNSRALSPKGARGLMQLMPATAARFGVSDAHDPAQSIRAGTRYLKELMRRFNGRVDLALAGYNAGEGTVMKYGHRVPPYRETRNYVRRITARYSGGD